MTTYTTAFTVTYSSAVDGFVIAFSGGVPSNKTVRRVGFTYLENPKIANGVTFFSKVTTEYQQQDGITVSWALCTSPVASSALDLYNKIVALYTGGGPVVSTLNVTAPITNTGTATDPIIGHATAGTAGTYAYPTEVITNATGHVTSVTAGTQPVQSITAGTNITLGGTAANPIINASGGGGGGGVLPGFLAVTSPAVSAASNIYTTNYVNYFDTTGGAWNPTTGVFTAAVAGRYKVATFFTCTNVDPNAGFYLTVESSAGPIAGACLAGGYNFNAASSRAVRGSACSAFTCAVSDTLRMYYDFGGGISNASIWLNISLEST